MKIIESLSHMLPRISEQDRVSTCDEISLSAYPGFDFYLLVLLSGRIATLGLLTNSAAVIIGAMLQIGRASSRERVWISVVAEPLKPNITYIE